MGECPSNESVLYFTCLIVVPLVRGVRLAPVDDDNRRSLAEVRVADRGAEDVAFLATIRTCHTGSPRISARPRVSGS